jgi:hypothetical protein
VIRVTVELISARSGKTEKLAEMHICNDGTGTDAKAHYTGRVLKKPAFSSIVKMGKVMNHKRYDLHVWHLVGKMLANMGYA